MTTELDPISAVTAGMAEAAATMRVAKGRIDHLEYLLHRLLLLIDDTLADSEGVWPQPNVGCIVCTSGTVPDARNTGLCALHAARKALGIRS